MMNLFKITDLVLLVFSFARKDHGLRVFFSNLEFTDSNQVQNEAVTYGVTAFNQSSIATAFLS